MESWRLLSPCSGLWICIKSCCSSLIFCLLGPSDSSSFTQKCFLFFSWYLRRLTLITWNAPYHKLRMWLHGSLKRVASRFSLKLGSCPTCIWRFPPDGNRHFSGLCKLVWPWNAEVSLNCRKNLKNRKKCPLVDFWKSEWFACPKQKRTLKVKNRLFWP